MAQYFLKRLLLIIPTFLGVTLLVFTITRFVPGGPVERAIMQARGQADQMGGSDIASSSPLSDEQINELKAYYGFDKPIFVSYIIWLKKVLRLDLGVSTRYHDSVWETIKERFPISLLYGILTLILVYSICIPLGVIKAIKHKQTIDNLSSVIVFIAYAIPSYVIGITLLYAFSSNLEIFPLGGFVSENFGELESIWEKIWDVAYHAALPLTAYVAGSFAVTTFMMKNSLMDNISADYVKTAVAKGLSFNKTIVHHAMRNSLIPIATSFGNNISIILTGSFLIETIFNIDGFGLLGYESVVERDYPVVMGILVISSLLFLIGNILSDICVAIVDPRIKFGKGEV